MMTDEKAEVAKVEPAPVRGKPRLQAAVLLAGHREVIIEHAGEEYRLRLTKQGKLLLTK